MKISYNWLKEYVHFYLSPQELADRLTSVGLVVAGIQSVEDDFCLEVEVTSNRPDCLGIIGIAREVAAAAGGTLHLPEIHFQDTNSEIKNFIDIAVEEPMLCPHYTARIVRHVMVEPSPEWMQKRLKCMGLRPVNNIVDVTNYVMIETGQPIHAFDLDKISDQRIIVRKASNGEEIVVINGARRVLFPDMLVIADGKRPIAIAGIMGGKETEVSESTRNILLECAQFDPGRVRRTSKVLGIASDSSYRFERGIDPEAINYVSQRAIKLMKECADGEIIDGIIDVRSGRFMPRRVTLRIEQLHKVMGVEIEKAEAVDILKRLQFHILSDGGTFVHVEVPSFRGDIYREIDLIEEVARIYGYHNIPTRTSICIRGSTKSKCEIVEDSILQFLNGLGFYEVKTFSIVDTSALQAINLWSDKESIDIANPLRQEESRLRTCLLPNLIRSKIYNMHHGVERVKIFEISKVYLAGDKLPQEKTCLSFIADGDFYSTKGIVESLLLSLGIFSKCEWKLFHEPKLFHEERTAVIFLDNKVLGYLGEASKELRFKTLSCLLELDMDLLIEKSNFSKKYQNLPQYPPVLRDLAIIVDEEVTWASIERCIIDTKVLSLKEINFFDIYRGKQIPTGKKSVAFNLFFQADDRTLRSEDVDIFQRDIMDNLQKTLGAELRKL